MSEQERNLRVAKTLCRDFELDGQRFSKGDFVALLDAKVIAVAKTPEEAISSLRAVAPNPLEGMVVEVAVPTVDIIR